MIWDFRRSYWWINISINSIKRMNPEKPISSKSSKPPKSSKSKLEEKQEVKHIYDEIPNDYIKNIKNTYKKGGSKKKRTNRKRSNKRNTRR